MTRELDLTADLIDVRDIIARVEELESEREALAEDHAEAQTAFFENKGATAGADLDAATETLGQWDTENAEELRDLRALLADLAGTGGDEQFEGDWYPVTLIDDLYFKTYAQDLAEDIGAINPDASWPNDCIDWDKAARQLRMDYTCVTVGGRDYLTR